MRKYLILTFIVVISSLATTSNAFSFDIDSTDMVQVCSQIDLELDQVSIGQMQLKSDRDYKIAVVRCDLKDKYIEVRRQSTILQLKEQKDLKNNKLAYLND